MHKYSPGLLLYAFLICWLLFTALTIPDYGVTWDEPLYYRAAQGYGDWFGLVFSGNWDIAFDSKTIDSYWQYNSQHPPLTKLVAAFTYFLTHRWFDEIIAFRLAELIWYIALLLLVYHVANYVYGKKVAWVSMLATAFMPRLFADAHLLELDLPLATVWLFTVYAFYRGIGATKDERMIGRKDAVASSPPSAAVILAQRPSFIYRPVFWSIICGIAFSLALLTKVMAIFILIPLLLWAQIFQRGKYTNNLFSMFILGPLIFVLCWPWLWHNTLTRILDYYAFFFLMESPLKTFYFGHAYASTPWHYPFVMTLFTVPIGILTLALFGIWKTVGARFPRPFFKKIKNIRAGEPSPYDMNSFSSLLIINIFFFLIFFALPSTLAIDGVRYFLPIFPMLAIFAGIGFNHIVKVLGTRYKVQITKDNNYSLLLAKRSSFFPRSFIYCLLLTAVCLLVFLVPLFSIRTYHPYQLSYYNELVGGISGATKLGMETTYWGEVNGKKELDWINRNFPPNATAKILPAYPAKNVPVEALSFYPDVIVYYQQRGLLRRDINFFASPPYNYLLLVTRQGLFTSNEWYYYKDRQPKYQVSRSGVQLLGIYKLN